MSDVIQEIEQARAIEKERKRIISQMEALEKNAGWEVIVKNIDNNIEILKDQILNTVGKDFEDRYSIHDVNRFNIRLLEQIKNIPSKIILENSKIEENDSIGYGAL